MSVHGNHRTNKDAAVCVTMAAAAAAVSVCTSWHSVQALGGRHHLYFTDAELSFRSPSYPHPPLLAFFKSTFYQHSKHTLTGGCPNLNS